MFRILILSIVFSILAPSTFAEQAVGDFNITDGSTIRAMEDEYGTMSYVGHECWFVMPDGKRIDVPQHRGGNEGSCLILTKANKAEIYIYPTVKGRLPVVSRVLQFDGKQFLDVTSPGKRWLSPFIHTWHYLVGYLVSIVIYSPFLFLGAYLVRRVPANKCGMVWRASLVIIGIFMTLVYGIFASIYGPYSPLVFLVVLSLIFIPYQVMRYLTVTRKSVVATALKALK